MSLASLFANPQVVQSIGAANLLETLPPTSETGEVVAALETAIEHEASKGVARDFKAGADAFNYLLKVGGRPRDFLSQLRRMKSVAKKLNSDQVKRVLEGSGLQSASRKFARRYNSIPEVKDAMVEADIRLGETIEALAEFVSIPGVSFLGHPFKPVHDSAEWVADRMKKAGFRNIRILKVRGAHPSVYGELIGDPKNPTAVFYSHLDVQPAEAGGEKGEWLTDPFKAIARRDRLYGRGAADDKAGVMVPLAAIEAYREAGIPIPVNVILFIEGEEEIGSLHLGPILAKLPSNLKVDAVVLTDTENFRVGWPSVTISTRGVVRVDVKVEALKKEVHSGMKGGVVLDANTALHMLVASFRRKDGNLHIPGLTDLKPPLSPQIRRLAGRLPFSAREFRETSGMFRGSQFLGRSNWPVPLRIWRDWALHSLVPMGTRTRENFSGVVVPRANDVLEMRVPFGFDAKRAAKRFVEALKKNAPSGVRVRTQVLTSIEPWESEIDIGHTVYQMMCGALEMGYGREPTFVGCGGGIGFLDEFQRRFPGVPLVAVGVEDPYTNAHGANESVHLKDFGSAIRSAIAFLALMGGYETK